MIKKILSEVMDKIVVPPTIAILAILFLFFLGGTHTLFIFWGAFFTTFKCALGLHDKSDTDYETVERTEDVNHPGWFHVKGLGRVRSRCHYCKRVIGDWRTEDAG